MRLLALLVLAATPVYAHIVPVPPSTCAFDPVEITAPTVGVTAAVAAPAPADQFRVLYDPQASQAQFDLTGVPPRAFTAAGVSGTLALPTVFAATLLNSGDLTASMGLAFAMNASTVTVPVTLTTGLAAASGSVVEGAPIGSDGRFTLVGLAPQSGLGAPFGPGMLVVRLSCLATPRPDTDQFAFATQTTPVSAVLTAQTLKLRAIFAPGTGATPSFPDVPAILHATSGGAEVTAVDLPGGLQAQRKLFVGRSDDGLAVLAVRRLRRNGQTSYLLGVRIQNPALPAVTTSPVRVQVSYQVGGVLSRMSLPFRVLRHGARLRFP